MHRAQFIFDAGGAVLSVSVDHRRLLQKHAPRQNRVPLVHFVGQMLLHEMKAVRSSVVHEEGASEHPQRNQAHQHADIFQHALAREVLDGGCGLREGRRGTLQCFCFSR